MMVQMLTTDERDGEWLDLPDQVVQSRRYRSFKPSDVLWWDGNPSDRFTMEVETWRIERRVRADGSFGHVMATEATWAALRRAGLI